MMKKILAAAMAITLTAGAAASTSAMNFMDFAVQASAADQVNGDILSTPGEYVVPISSLTSGAPLPAVKEAFSKAFGDSVIVTVHEDGTKTVKVATQHMAIDMSAMGMGIFDANVTRIDGATVLSEKEEVFSNVNGSLANAPTTDKITVPDEMEFPLALDENNSQMLTIGVDFMAKMNGMDIDKYSTNVTLTLDVNAASAVENSLSDGVYEVPVYLWNASADRASMAASSLNEKAKLIVKNGEITMYIYTKPMTFGSIIANLQEIKVSDGNGGYTIIGKVESADADGNPTSFSFKLPNTEEYVPVLVNPHVEMMGNSDLEARLKIDYSSIKFVENTSTELNGCSLSLSGDIGLNFFMDLSSDVLKDNGAKIQFTLPDGSIKDVSVNSAAPSENGYKFTANVAAKEMASDVKAEVILSDGTSVATFTQSVKEYADSMLNDTTGTYSAEAISLVKAMLNYGGYAQEYFAYNTANPANISLTSDEKMLSSVTDLSGYQYSVSGSENGIKYSGSKLSLESETAVKHYFSLTGDKTIADYTFTVNGTAAAPVQSGNMYYVTVEGISAKNLAENYAVTVGGLTLDYSAMSYANSALTQTDKTALQNVTKALYLYNQAAVNYTK